MHVERFHTPADPVPVLAVFIMLTEDGTHAGILHKVEGRVFIQDLLWHERLRSEPRKNGETHYFVEPMLEEEEVNDVTAMCRLIHDRYTFPDPTRRNSIPYAFRYPNNARFNAQNGELMLGDGLGLTCSTFVLAVFESVNTPLVNFDGWPIRDDDHHRHQALLQKMREGIPNFSPPAVAEHVARVEAELPCIRVRPEEVASAGAFEALPVGFAQIGPAGSWILEQLAAAA